MTLFLLFSIPVAGFLYLWICFSGQFQSGETWRVFFRGVISFLISVLPMYIVISSYSFRYSGAALFFRAFITDFLIPTVFVLGFFFLWEKRKIEYEYGQRLFAHIFSFVTGFFSLTGVFYGFVYFEYYSGYRLFGYPLLMVTLMITTAVSLYLYSVNQDWQRYLYAVIPVFTGLLFTIVPISLQLSHTVWGTITGLLLPIIGAACICFLQSRRIIPGK